MKSTFPKRVLFLSLAILYFVPMGSKAKENMRPLVSMESQLENRQDTVTQLTNSRAIGYMDTYEQLPVLEFKDSDQSEFESAPAPIKSKVTSVDSSSSYYYFTTATEVIKMKMYNSEAGVLLTDFYANTHWHVFTSHSYSDGFSFGWLNIVDSLTSLNYGIVSITDWSVETPCFSPDGKYLVYFDNYTYDNKDCFIGVLKVNEKERFHPKKYLTEFRSYRSYHWAIEELRWLNANTIVIKGYEQIYRNKKWIKEFTYIKTRIL